MNLFDPDTLKDLTSFIDRFNVEDDYILSKTGENIETYLQDMVDNNYLDINYSNHISHSYYPDGSPDYEVNLAGVESDVHNSLESFLDGFNLTVLQKIDIDTSRIASGIDIDRMVTRYMEDMGNDYQDDDMRGYNSGSSSHDDIDAVFER